MINTPLSKSDRINELDIFRGFAILGIFMVNILVMNVSFAYRGEWETEQVGWLQQSSLFVLETLFYSKFFPLFSLLFGTGVALQIQSAKQKGNYSNAFFIRRFGALLLFGLIHILFIWSGDILHLYALFGFLLLLLFMSSAKTLLWLAAIVFLFPFYTYIFEQIADWFQFDYNSPLTSLSRAEIMELKHHGSYVSGMSLRLKEYAFATPFIYSGIAPIALSMMLLGGYIVKRGWLNNLYEKLIQVGPYLFGTLAILLIYRFSLIYWIMPSFDIPFGSALSIALFTIYQLSDICITFSMIWMIGYLWNKDNFKQLLSPLRYVGRMALSNYIFQSIVGYLIMRTFNGYEYFSAFECILLVLTIYSVQIFISKLWLTYFEFGPLEWFWRCISYIKLLPIRKSINE